MLDDDDEGLKSRAKCVYLVDQLDRSRTWKVVTDGRRGICQVGAREIDPSSKGRRGYRWQGLYESQRRSGFGRRLGSVLGASEGWTERSQLVSVNVESR
jgi:hypothetical protein